MADNYNVKDASAATIAMAAKEISAVKWVQNLFYGLVGGAAVPVAMDSNGVLGVQGPGQGIPITSAPLVANPSSTLTTVANTTAYSAGDLLANNSTAGSVTPPSLTVGRVAASQVKLNRFRLRSAGTNLSGVNILVDLWSSAPTFTNGDNGAYAVATSGAGAYWLGQLTFAMQQLGDAGVAAAVLPDGPMLLKLAAGVTDIYWSAQILSALSKTSAQAFTLTAEVEQG